MDGVWWREGDGGYGVSGEGGRRSDRFLLGPLVGG
jgi:hypothetical protein